jgi:hypothetical protein
MAQTELRVRDVVSSHPPLIGLAGRIGPFGAGGGSHPGPISFYALWPVWTLFGRSAFGLFAANVALDLVAVGLALWIAFRRGGIALTLAMAAVLAVLMRAYGAFVLTLPWNPYLPVLWWFVFLLAAWSVLVDDFAMLAVAVFAGTFCMQTHISYLGLVGGIVALVAVVVVIAAFRRRGDHEARRAIWRWSLVAIVLGVVLWVPPVMDQAVHSPGNLSVIRDHFSNPPETPIGLHAGLDEVLGQLNPVKLVREILVTDRGLGSAGGTRLPGFLLVVVFAGSVVLAWTARQRALLRLDVVIGAALVLGVVSAARIFGYVWYYLLLWAWGLVALMLLAIGWSVVSLIRATPRWERAGTAALVVVVVGFAGALGVDAAGIVAQSPRINRTLGALVGPTADALAAVQRRGGHGPSLVTWLPDAQGIGGAGFGLLNELDRRGFDVRAIDAFRPGATRYRVVDPSRASRQVHFATGVDIERWRADSRFAEVAAFDPRTDAERAEFDRLRGEVIDELSRAGLHDRIAEVDTNLFGLGGPPDPHRPPVPDHTRRVIGRMLAIGMPCAVFIGPVGEPR